MTNFTQFDFGCRCQEPPAFENSLKLSESRPWRSFEVWNALSSRRGADRCGEGPAPPSTSIGNTSLLGLVSAASFRAVLPSFLPGPTQRLTGNGPRSVRCAADPRGMLNCPFMRHPVAHLTNVVPWQVLPHNGHPASFLSGAAQPPRASANRYV